MTSKAIAVLWKEGLVCSIVTIRRSDHIREGDNLKMHSHNIQQKKVMSSEPCINEKLHEILIS